MNPRVKAVVPQNDFELRITFTNGEVGIFDCAHLLTFGVFKELEDIRYFRQSRVLDGTVAWPHEQDICPDTLYEDSTKIASVRIERSDAAEPKLRPVSDGQSAF